MPIKILDPQVVSKIAAGEVVERPSSVVKELIENSLDAGATFISVESRGGGSAMLKISDNGHGIPAGEVELAFARHSTSKINRLEDLESLATLGFRGEALPSIAAVADVEIATQADNESAGCYLRLVGGRIIFTEKRSRQTGTTITVHHLFRHLPARLKFLKSAATENSHIANLMTQYALAFPEVKFNLTIDGRLTVSTPGNGKLLDVVAGVYTVEIAEQMKEVEYKEQEYRITGMASPPSLSRSNRNYLSFFVNRRWIHSGIAIRAAEDAYQGLLMTNKHPIVILNIYLPAADIDVNVHPSKTEVKFRNNQTLYNAIYKAVKQAVATSPVPEMKTSAIFSPPPAALSFWDRTSGVTSSEAKSMPSAAPKSPPVPSVPVLRVVGQLSATYIMAEGPEGLYLIDQHAAHERILFEKILAQHVEHKPEIQGLLEPLLIELTPQQEETFNSSTELIAGFGLDMEHFGGRSYLLRAVPAIMTGSHLASAVGELIDDLATERDPQKRQEKLVQSLACHSAVRAGQTMEMEEMRALVRQLEVAQQPRTCPHGRPTMIHLSSHQLEREFGRIR